MSFSSALLVRIVNKLEFPLLSFFGILVRMHLGVSPTLYIAFNRWEEIIKDKVLMTVLADRLTPKAILSNMTRELHRLKKLKK